MHFMLAWGRRGDKPPLTEEEHKVLEEALEGHSWASVCPGIYVVALTYGPSERIDLRLKLKAKIKGEGLGPVTYLLSPPIDGDAGFYIGATDAANWDEINRRSGHTDIVAKSAGKVSD
jgi:hypothetical protein